MPLSNRTSVTSPFMFPLAVSKLTSCPSIEFAWRSRCSKRIAAISSWVALVCSKELICIICEMNSESFFGSRGSWELSSTVRSLMKSSCPRSLPKLRPLSGAVVPAEPNVVVGSMVVMDWFSEWIDASVDSRDDRGLLPFKPSRPSRMSVLSNLWVMLWFEFLVPRRLDLGVESSRKIV